MRSKIIALGIVLVLLASGIGTVSAFSNSGDGDWKYYKEITVKENSGETLTNFQVLVELNPSNFPAKAKSDGSDLRFEDASGKELSYWIEDWNAGAKKPKIWIKVPNIPANGETTIKMHYGNPSASAVSDGGKVFEFFDDFSTDTSSKYTIENIFQEGGYLNWDSSKKRLKLTTSWYEGGTAGWNAFYYNERKFKKDISVESKITLLDGGIDMNDNGICFNIMSRYIPGGSHGQQRTGIMAGLETRNSDWRDSPESAVIKKSQDGILAHRGYSYSIGDTYKFRLNCFRSNSDFYINDDLVLSKESSEVLNNGYVGWLTYASNVAVDDFKVRKYTSPEPTLTFSAEHPIVKPKSATSYVYYEEDFETDPGYTSLSSEYAYWDSEQGNYYVKTFDNVAHKYWAYSPKFQTVDVNRDIIVELDMMCENLDWGTYPGVAFYYDNPDTIEGYVFKVEFHWDDPYGKNLGIADSYKHTHWANTQPKSNVWYHVKLKYHSSTQKADIYITEKSTGESFFIKENADFRIDPFCYLGIGYYNEPDYGNEWSPIRVDNIRIVAIGKPPALTPTPTSTPPAPSPTPVSQEHIKFIVTPLGDGKYNITYTEYAPFTVKILRYSDGKGIAGVSLYQLEPKEIIEASKEYLQQNAPNIIGTQLTERAITKILEEAGVYVFSGPFGVIIKVFSNLATAVDYLSYLTTPYIDLGAITDNEGKATLYLPNRAYTTTMDMSAFITQTQEPIDQTAPATQEQIAEQIASIILPTIQEELQPIARTDITLAIPTKITIDDKGVVTTETAEELKTYTEFRAINSKAVGNSRELTFWVEPREIPPATIGTGEGEEEKMMKAHVLSQDRSLFPHVVSLSHYFQNKGINCGYIDLIGHLADINEWVALNSPLESRWPSPEDDFTVVISSKEDKPKWKQTIKQFPQETVLQGSGWEVTKYTQTSADISGEHERFIFSIVVTDDEKREEAIKAFIENADQLGMPIEKEKEIPGFEVVFAIAGLLAVAYVLRRKK